MHIQGNKEEKFLRASCKKGSKWIDWLAGEKVSFDQVPKIFQKTIKRVGHLGVRNGQSPEKSEIQELKEEIKKTYDIAV